MVPPSLAKMEQMLSLGSKCMKQKLVQVHRSSCSHFQRISSYPLKQIRAQRVLFSAPFATGSTVLSHVFVWEGVALRGISRKSPCYGEIACGPACSYNGSNRNIIELRKKPDLSFDATG